MPIDTKLRRLAIKVLLLSILAEGSAGVVLGKLTRPHTAATAQAANRQTPAGALP